MAIPYYLKDPKYWAQYLIRFVILAVYITVLVLPSLELYKIVKQLYKKEQHLPSWWELRFAGLVLAILVILYIGGWGLKEYLAR
jgi:hypothetical protein